MTASPSRKRKILYISPDSGPLESQINLYHLLRHLDRNQYDALVTVHREGALAEKVRALGWPVVRLPRIRLAKTERPPMHGVGERLTWWLWKRTRGEKLVKLIRDEQIDLIHTTSIICFEGAYAANKTKLPHIWCIQEILPGNRRLFGVFGTRKTLKTVARYAHKVVCVSDAVKRQFAGWQRQPDKYVTLYGGVDLDLFNPENTVAQTVLLRQRFSIPNDVPLLLTIANISAQKGLADLVDACALLKQDGIPFYLVVLGGLADNRDGQPVQDLIHQSGLSHQIGFLDALPRDDLPGVLQQSDLFVSVVYNEPLSRPLLEAMAMGLAVIGPTSGGTPEVVHPNKTGVLYKPGVPGSLAQGLKQLLENPGQWKSLGQAARQQILAQFTLDGYARRMLALYDELLE